MKKLFVTLLTVLSLFAGLMPAASAAYARITDASAARGADYTDNPYIAEKLDEIFAGQIGLFRDTALTKPVSAPLGSRVVAPGTVYYIASENDGDRNWHGGYSCYIYANAVYAALFGDVPGAAWGGGWQHSRVLVRNKASVSYELFTKLGVKTGALLRSTSNADGSYNGQRGHSVIILRYDKNGVDILDGNGDGKGIIRITRYTWNEFNRDLFSRRGYRLSFIVQPEDAYYEELRHDYIGYFRCRRDYEGSFVDVTDRSWSYQNVVTAYELGLMNGKSGEVFAPGERITAVEALTLTARLLSGYYDDQYDFTPAPGAAWFDPYLQYCQLWGINTASYGELFAPITRADFARLIARALPAEALTAVRDIPDRSIPDLAPDMTCYRVVYELYEAGILNGSGEGFRPADFLTREQAAAILSRAVDLSQRVA